MNAARYADACRLAEQALAMAPSNPSVLGDYAPCLMRDGRHEAAYRVYRQIDALPPEHRNRVAPTWIDGLAEVCGWLGKADELRQYGQRSLQAADARYRDHRRWDIPAHAPLPFDPTQPSRNVIAYSLYGANPRYGEPAVMNARIAAELFPGWTCRFYLDNTVPAHVAARLRAASAQVVVVDEATRRTMPGTMWRFLVLDDPTVDRFMVRDADSLLSEREVPAIAAWIASGRWFHHMRDYFTHTELLLAGLWAGCRGALPPIAPLIESYAQTQPPGFRFTDQYFLRELLWPTIRDSLLSHDELFGFHGAEPFPPHPPVRWGNATFHVGSNASYRRIGGPSNLADGMKQTLLLSHEGSDALHYDATVSQGHWYLDLPFFLIEAFEAGRLTVRLAEASNLPG